MIDDEKAKGESLTDNASPAKPRPEEMGRNVTGTGEAIEPEATHSTGEGAIKAGDRMWGPPGTPSLKD